MKSDTLKIDTVPLPDRPVSIEIPMNLLVEFIDEPRIVVRHPWVVGIPAPLNILKKLADDPKAFGDISKKCDFMLVPKARK